MKRLMVAMYIVLASYMSCMYNSIVPQLNADPAMEYHPKKTKPQSNMIMLHAKKVEH